MRDDIRNAFERTTCACSECVACCKRQPGPLAKGDLERIAAFLGESESDARRHFTASAGALVGDTRTGRTFRVGTITPKRSASGACVFLDEHERCSIHPVSPAGCALFDTHMGLTEAANRSGALVCTQMDRDYQQLRDDIAKENE